MLTRTWFHTGAFTDAQAVTQQYLSEYWIEPALRAPGRDADAAAMRPPDTVLPDGLDAFEVQEAYRALKGHALRIETYADDGSPAAANPYTVTEQNFTIRCLQHMGENLHAVFFVQPREALSFHYERGRGDPRVSHEITLETDAYGNVAAQRLDRLSAPRRVRRRRSRRCRRRPGDAGLRPGAPARPGDRAPLHQRRSTTPTPGRTPTGRRCRGGRRAPRSPASPRRSRAPGSPACSPSTRSTAPAASGRRCGPGARRALRGDPGSDVDGAGTPAAAPTRRFIAGQRVLYRSDDLTALLPPGQLQPLALPGQSYQAALTPGLLSAIFGALVPGGDPDRGRLRAAARRDRLVDAVRPGVLLARRQRHAAAGTGRRAGRLLPAAPRRRPVRRDHAAPTTTLRPAAGHRDRPGRQRHDREQRLPRACSRRRSPTPTATGCRPPSTPSARSPPPR